MYHLRPFLYNLFKTECCKGFLAEANCCYFIFVRWLKLTAMIGLNSYQKNFEINVF